VIIVLLSIGCGQSEDEKEERDAMQKQANHLVDEKSPYLLQHLYNPVDWYPWDEVAFEKARREHKPIFLSIGYSTCHWCHVMARESFENEDVARILNRLFVSIKVDREERPDIDRVYMTYVQATTGGGGWPLSVWLTPELKPFFGGTYFPPEDKWGAPGFTNVLNRIAQAWQHDQARVSASADAALDFLRDATAVQQNEDVTLNASRFDEAYTRLAATYDAQHGGFGKAPKFPRPVVTYYLLHYHARTPGSHALEMVQGKRILILAQSVFASMICVTPTILPLRAE